MRSRFFQLASLIVAVMALSIWRGRKRRRYEAELWAAATDPVN